LLCTQQTGDVEHDVTAHILVTAPQPNFITRYNVNPHGGATADTQLHAEPMGEYRNGVNSRYSKMRSILIINPNSTEQMTNGLKPLVDALQFKDVNQHHSPHPSSD
jgi:hypothetical protein